MEFDKKLHDGLVEMMAVTTKCREQGEEKFKKCGGMIDDLYARLGAPDGGTKENRMFANNGYKSAGTRLAGNFEEMTKSLGMTKRYCYQVGNMFAEQKSSVGSSDVGFSTPGVISAQRVEGIIPGARRRLTIRDLLRTKPVTTSLVDFPKESSFTSNASPQTELSTKGESTFALTVASARVSTIAHYVTVSRQLLDDVVGVRDYIDQSMLYYLKLKEELELLSGDGLGTHQNGLTTQATAGSGAYAVAGDTIIDKLFHLQTELSIADEECNFYVLNPIDWARVNLVKQETGGANTGSYIVGDPNAPGQVMVIPTIWGRPVIVTRSMSAGKVLCGDSSKAFICDRQDATIDISFEHASTFIQNAATILAENRVALCVTRPGAFRYASI